MDTIILFFINSFIICREKCLYTQPTHLNRIHLAPFSIPSTSAHDFFFWPASTLLYLDNRKNSLFLYYYNHYFCRPFGVVHKTFPLAIQTFSHAQFDDRTVFRFSTEMYIGVSNMYRPKPKHYRNHLSSINSMPDICKTQRKTGHTELWPAAVRQNIYPANRLDRIFRVVYSRAQMPK